MGSLPQIQANQAPPEYAESNDSKTGEIYANQPRMLESSLSLPQQVAKTRSRRINSIITSHIEPLLESHASSGLYHYTSVLVPSNVESLQTSTAILEGTGDIVSQLSEESVIGFPSNDYVKLVRLQGEEYSAEFWKQAAVMTELEDVLKARLRASGHKIVDTTVQPKEEPTVVADPSIPKKRDWLGRRFQSSSTAAPSFEPLHGTWNPPKKVVVPSGHIRVNIDHKEICLRVHTPMGLYETRNGKAVVVDIEVGM